MAEIPKTACTTVKIRANRATYDRDAINAILDEGMVCHVGVQANESTLVSPMVYGRNGDVIYLHGASNCGTVSALLQGSEACINVVLNDGILMGPEPFFHAVHFRSVTLFGKAKEVTDRDDKLAGLRAIIEHVVPGRWNDIPAPSEADLQAVCVLTIPITEASAKVFHGSPPDSVIDGEDHCWAGVLPLALEPQAPITDPRIAPGIEPPEYVTNYRRPGHRGPRHEAPYDREH